MMSNLTPVMIWLATYFLHSSLLLGSVWCWFKWREPRSHALRETVWKLAAAGGFVTASLQLGLSIESPVNTALRTAWVAPSVVSNATINSTTPSTAVTTSNAAVTIAGRSDRGVDVQILPRLLTTPPRFHFQNEPVQIENAALEFDSIARPQFLDFAPDDAPPATTLAADSSIKVPLRLTVPPSIPVANPTAVAMTQLPTRSTTAQLASRLSGAMSAIFAAIGGALAALSAWGLYRLLAEQTEFRQRLAGCHVAATGVARGILNDLLRQAGVRRSVTLLLAEDDLEPGACGWRQWQIVLPARAVEELSPQELRALLAHELAHLVRGDQWWLLMGRLLVVCFGWQPFNRVALREWQRASEYLCDAWAIQRDVERISLARCLTTVAEWRLVGMATVAGLGSGNRSNLTGRVERLIDDAPLLDPWQGFSRRHLLSAAGTLVAIGMVGYAPAATLSAPQSKVVEKQVVTRTESDSDDASTSAHSLEPVSELQLVTSSTSLVREEMSDNFRASQIKLLPVLDTPASELVPIRASSDFVIGIELIQAIQQQVTSDMNELSAELHALEVAISQMPPTAQRPLWQAQLQRFRQRVANVQRLREAMLPL